MKVWIVPNSDGQFDIDDYLNGLTNYVNTLPSYQILKKSVDTQFIPKDIVKPTLDFVNEEEMEQDALLYWKENDDYKSSTQRLIKFRDKTKNIIEYADPETQQKHIEKMKFDMDVRNSEPDINLANEILEILRKDDVVQSKNVLAAILNQGKARNLNAHPQSQLSRVLRDLKKKKQICYLPIELEYEGKTYSKGWHLGFIPIEERLPKRKYPTFSSVKERNAWELKTFGSKNARKEALTKEAVRLYKAKNPKTHRMWTMKDIGAVLGGYKETAIWRLLRDANINTKRRGRS